MNPDQLWETTLDPKQRNMLKVELVDDENTENVFEDLMNSKLADRRKVFLLKNQNMALDLDLN